MLVCAQSNSVLAEAAGVPPRLPVADFMRFPAYSQVKLSPSGRYLAMQVPAPERKALAVMDLTTRKVEYSARYPDWDVVGFEWVNDDRLVFWINDQKSTYEDQLGFGLFGIDRNGENFKELCPTLAMQTSDQHFYFHYIYKSVFRLFAEGDEIIVKSNAENLNHPQLYRLNTRTARMSLISGGIPGDVSSWVLDKNNIVRAAVRYERRKGVLHAELIYRSSASSPWEVLSETGQESKTLKPVALSADETELYVVANSSHGTRSLFSFDIRARKLGDMLAGHPRVDLPKIDPENEEISLENLAFDLKTHEILGARYEAERGSAVWFDDRRARLQSGLDKAIPDHVNTIASFSGSRAVVRSFSDRDPGRFYLWEDKSGNIEELFAEMSWINPEQMSEMRPIEYLARDGMKIPAYLTLPAGRPARNLPLIVMPHGGPFGVRDDWRWDGEVQFLANRGYAVLQPQFRGSGGYGRKHYSSGFRQWGGAMQDDLSDGVKYLVAQGTVDPQRVAIVGASYGGYAALAGGAYTPELYRGVVSRYGVSDILLMFRSNYWREMNDEEWFNYGAREMIGDPDKDEKALQARSPVNAAKNFQVPVLITQGSKDVRVIPKHATDMAAALRAAGKPVELMMVQGEGHGFYKESNRVDEWTKIEAYLKKTIGD
ncbi:alpha/beta hydrolase family protein [Niveibacterium terrae]|uniref:alpha/beta hydrolase family protein n=1 Tax=Niveibacterium terrae TaxID=3373598 RepID=UPI003A8EB341